jgi:hypothetical protein
VLGAQTMAGAAADGAGGRSSWYGGGDSTADPTRTVVLFLGCLLSECSLSLRGVVVQMKVCMQILHCGAIPGRWLGTLCGSAAHRQDAGR